MGVSDASRILEQVMGLLPSSPSLLNDQRLFNQRIDQIIDLLNESKRELAK